MRRGGAAFVRFSGCAGAARSFSSNALPTAHIIERGMEMDLNIKSLIFGGEGMSRTDDNFVVLVSGKGALPGAQVRAKIVKVDGERRNYKGRKPNGPGKVPRYAEATVVEILEPSPHAVEPECPHFANCGGCSAQDLDYSQQLAEKRDQVVAAFQRLSKFPDAAKMVQPVVPFVSDNTLEGQGTERDNYPLRYRVKMGLSCSANRFREKNERDDEREQIEAPQHALRNPNFTVGLHPKGEWRKVIRIDDCRLMHPDAVAVYQAMVAELETACDTFGWTAVDKRKNKGIMEELTIQIGGSADQADRPIMITLHSTVPLEQEAVAAVASRVAAQHPQLVVVANSVRPLTPPKGYRHQPSKVLWGQSHIDIELRGLRFQLSPDSFFQTNLVQANVLLQKVEAAVIDLNTQLAKVPQDQGGKPMGSLLAYDLYCGTGSFGLVISPLVSHVVGFESVSAAVHDARRNAEANQIENASFVDFDLNTILRSYERTSQNLPGIRDKGSNQLHVLKPADVVITNPPRSGMHADCLKVVTQFRPKRIIYVSCNPATQARDVGELLESGYTLASITPVDMFPHTPHVEVVAVLDRKDAPHVVFGQNIPGAQKWLREEQVEERWREEQAEKHADKREKQNLQAERKDAEMRQRAAALMAEHEAERKGAFIAPEAESKLSPDQQANNLLAGGGLVSPKLVVPKSSADKALLDLLLKKI